MVPRVGRHRHLFSRQVPNSLEDLTCGRQGDNDLALVVELDKGERIVRLLLDADWPVHLVGGAAAQQHGDQQTLRKAEAKHLETPRNCNGQ